MRWFIATQMRSGCWRLASTVLALVAMQAVLAGETLAPYSPQQARNAGTVEWVRYLHRQPCGPCPGQPHFVCPPSMMPGEPVTPGQSVPSVPDDSSAAAPYDLPSADQSLADLGDLGMGSGGVASAQVANLGISGGYIDDAWIRTRVRVRYDDMGGANAPTRAEYLYPTSGFYNGGRGPVVSPPSSPTANEVDLQELNTYVEFALSKRFSLFIETPVRWVGGHNDLTAEHGQLSGFGDLKTGFRYALLACPYEALTLQCRVYAPTGDASEALGVGHTSIETGLLYSAKTSDRGWFFAEFQDWQSLDSPTITVATDEFDLNANVLRYGLGLGYDLWQGCNCRCGQKRLTAIYEVVGWTVLDGYVTPINYSQITTGSATGIYSAVGDTIVNGKYGLRYSYANQSIYTGYGHNYTGDRWYSDLLRIEWQYQF